MSKTTELDYDIQELIIEGLSEKNIAQTLNCPIEVVYNWLRLNGMSVDLEEEFSPYRTRNS